MKNFKFSKLNNITRKLFSDAFLRKILYIVAIVGIMMVALKITFGVMENRQYNYSEEKTDFEKLFE